MTTIAILRPTDRMEESVELAKKMGFEVVFASPIDLKTNDSPEFEAFLKGLWFGDVDVASAGIVHGCKIHVRAGPETWSARVTQPRSSPSTGHRHRVRDRHNGGEGKWIKV